MDIHVLSEVVLGFIALCMIIMSIVFRFIFKRFDGIDQKFIKLEEKMDQRFALVDQKFNAVLQEIKEIRRDLSIMDKSIGALESETLLHTIPDENRRSEAAKKMWSRRKAKRLTHHLENT